MRCQLQSSDLTNKRLENYLSWRIAGIVDPVLQEDKQQDFLSSFNPINLWWNSPSVSESIDHRECNQNLKI